MDDEEEDQEQGQEQGQDEINTYLVDNVPYEVKDDEIMDPEDFSPIGTMDGKGGIIFEDDDAEEKHIENIQKYN